ncbi:MAG: FHA domain-containing protein [Ruminococcaceae bacterium]|nr:FHA domain-containing protein [Oscillospiraceae bacterium]
MISIDSNNNIIKYTVESFEEIDKISVGMLRENKIEGLIVPGVAKNDILIPTSNLTPLKSYLTTTGLKLADVVEIIFLEDKILRECMEYMIPEEQLILNIDFAYVNRDRIIENKLDGNDLNKNANDLDKSANGFNKNANDLDKSAKDLSKNAINLKGNISDYNKNTNNFNGNKLKLICIPTTHSYYLSRTETEFFASILSAGKYASNDEKIIAQDLVSYLYSEEYSRDEFLIKLEEVVLSNTVEKKSILKRIKEFFKNLASERDDLFNFDESDIPEKLCLITVRSSGDEYPLVFGPDLIGTDERVCSICFLDSSHPKMEKQHCRISISRGKCFIEDLNTASGTYVNGEKLIPGERRELESADFIAVPGEELVFTQRN